MSESNPAIALGAAIAFGALSVVLFLGSSSTEPEADLEARVSALETEVVTLRAELARRGERSRRGPSREGRSRGPRRATSATLDDEELARSIARSVTTGEAPSTEAVIEALDSGDPAVEETIGGLVRDQLEQEREERMERRRERMAERTARQLEELAESADLDDGQVTELQAALTQERDAIFALFRAAREEGTWDEAREQAEAIRASTDESVSGSLSRDQAEAWSEYRDEEAARRRR